MGRPYGGSFEEMINDKGDPSLGRFIQADSIVPGAGNPQAYDRYAYTLNNPLKYVDPSGHGVICNEEGQCWLNGIRIANIKFGTPPNLSTNILPSGEPWGLTDYGVAAFSGMTYLQTNSNDTLSSEDWLAYIIETEYLGSIGADPAWNAAMARRYRDYCSGGPFTSSCFNGFWGYMQAIRKTNNNPNLTKFTNWVLSPTAVYQSNIHLAQNIAYSIQNPSIPNSYGINATMTTCDDFKCDWVTIAPYINGDPDDPNSFYSYIEYLSRANNNWIYPSGDNFSLLLTVNQIIEWFGRYPYNMTNVTKAP